MSDLAQDIAAVLGEHVIAMEPVSGGCIAGALEVRTPGGRHFVKTGRGDVGQALDAEADGLRFLARAVGAGGLVVPAVVAFRAEGESAAAFLVLEWLETAPWTARAWEHLGRSLAALHRVTRPRYGHERDNWIGRLPQVNTPGDDWVTFYRDRRLQPQVERARANARWDPSWDAAYDRLLRTLEDRLPARPPAAVLHGDLWNGNVLSTTSGRGAVIDPAVYAGDRETDLAMTRLFGGFGDRFYAAYGEALPPEAGWEEREPVYQLYHVVNHLNHFGSGYAAAVGRLLRALV